MEKTTEKRKFKAPSAYTILFFLTIAIAILTWFVPAGQYAKTKDGNLIAHTYKAVASHPQGIWDVFMAPINGMIGTEATSGAIGVSLFILVIGGFLGVVNKTRVLDDGIASLVSKNKGKEKLLIPPLMILFAIGGSTYGMAEETLAFYPLLIPVMIAAGMDSLVAIGIVLIGSDVGCLASTVNPFATGVASEMLGISPGNGLISRLVLFVLVVGIAIAFVYGYAAKIEKDPTKSLLYNQREEDIKYFKIDEIKNTEVVKLTKTQVGILWAFIITFIIMIVSLIPWTTLNPKWTMFEQINSWIVGIPFIGQVIGKDMAPLGTWYFSEITMLFFFMSVIIMFIARMKEEDYIDAFFSGMKDFIGVAIVVAVARGIQVIMDSGMITATILHFGEVTLGSLSNVIFIVLTFIFYIPLSFLIPSTSGLAAATMGILGPLGKFSGVDPSLVITAFQCAEGMIGLIAPTSAVVMGSLTIAKVDFGTWVKWVGKLFIIYFFVLAAFLAVMALI